MRRRFIADEVTGDRAALTGTHAAHLSRVLRARVGQEFDITAAGRVRSGRIVVLTDARVEFELGEDVASAMLAPITLWLAVFKFDRLEWALEKATELGVARIVPLIASRTDAHLAAAAEKRRDRWQRILLQASEQSRRSVPPEIEVPVKLRKEVLAQAEGTRIVLAESEREVTLLDVLRPPQCEPPGGGERQTTESAAAPLHLAVGPEGGWTGNEIRMFVEAGWSAATLGATILRAETAAIAALAIAMAAA